MSLYASRLERDLKRWQEQGFINEAGAVAIRTDLAGRRSGFGAPQLFALLGAILFGFAAMSFVAANWNEMSKLARLALLVATLWACYAGAAYLMARQLPAFGHAAILGGIAMYGASIMLIAQMYHMEGNPPDAVLLWALGALLAAVLAQSRPALAATFVLICVWSTYERTLSEGPHYMFLALWAACALTAYWLSWRPGLHLAGIGLALWLAPLGGLVLDGHAHWLVVAIGAGVALAAAVGARQIDAVAPISGAAFAYAIATAYAGLFIMQFVDEPFLRRGGDAPSMRLLVILAVASLALLLASMVWAIRTNNRGALWLTYVGFAIEIMALYIKTFGSLLDTSLFFLVAAVIVSALAWLAYRLRQTNAAPSIGATP